MRLSRPRLPAAAVPVIAVLLLPVAAARAETAQSELFAVQDPRITESSGLAASALHADVYWTHNDSGDQPRIYAIGADGRTKATVTLAGVQARDWEAISAGKDDAGRPVLFVGDIGDNKAERSEVVVYRVAEPAELKDATVTPVKYRVRYADGPRDAEALMADPRSGKLYIASKANQGAVYEQPAALSDSAVNTFTRVAAAPPVVTDGAFSPDGTRLILRGYFGATMYAAPGREIGTVSVPFQKQGESVTFTRDGRAVLFGSEGANSTVYRVALEGEAVPDMAAGRGTAVPQAVPPGPGSAPSAVPALPAPGGGDQDGDAGRPKEKAYGPGFLAVFGIVLTVYVVMKIRGRKKG
ncbi:hypothetical protein [Yinghuangia aomiensis]|uniref:hypothetical protein n=1 Tax=Yinghuangia aomiensis TaxID=676205 RepID=UPI0031E94B71